MKPLLAALLVAAPLSAQSEPLDLQWWHPLAAAAGVSALFLIDEPVRDFLQDNRSETLDDIGSFAADFKKAEIYYATSATLFVAGVAARQPKIARTGVQVILSYGLSAGMMYGTKWALGRTRPSDTPDDAFEWNVFDGGASASFPSGSAANVFSIATTLSDAINHPAASVALYSAAGLNSWSRLNSDRHWLSDVVLGGLYGVFAAKVVNGRWRLFGLQPPQVLVGPDSAGLVFTTQF